MSTTTATLERPRPRGRLSEHLLQVLSGPPGPVSGLAASTRRAIAAGTDVSGNEDVQLALTILYELHYRGLRGVDDRWEWSPDLIGARALIEDAFEQELRAAVRGRAKPPPRPQDVPEALFALVDADDGPSLSEYLARTATEEQFREFLMHRSLYHLKEADPHSWAIPRLSGAPKAALVEIQADEYGGGRPERMHAALFATAMRGAGLDDGYGAYLDRLPAVTLAWANAFSLFGLQRRLRGAIGRAPGRAGDDLVAAERPLCPRRAPPRPAGGRRPGSSTSTSRRTRCTSRSPAGTWPAGWCGTSPAWPGTSSSARPSPCTPTPGWSRTCCRAGRTGTARCARPRPGGRPGRDVTRWREHAGPVRPQGDRGAGRTRPGISRTRRT